MRLASKRSEIQEARPIGPEHSGPEWTKLTRYVSLLRVRGLFSPKCVGREYVRVLEPNLMNFLRMIY